MCLPLAIVVQVDKMSASPLSETCKVVEQTGDMEATSLFMAKLACLIPSIAQTSARNSMMSPDFDLPFRASCGPT